MSEGGHGERRDLARDLRGRVCGGGRGRADGEKRRAGVLGGPGQPIMAGEQ